MTSGVPQQHESPRAGDSLAANGHRLSCVRGRPRFGVRSSTSRLLALLLGIASSLLFASSALGATASVGLGSAASFSVLAGSTVTNTGPTTMFGDLGLSPGSSVTGAPHVLGETHVDDAVAIGAKNALTTAYNQAAALPSNGSAGTDLAGQVFLPGVRTASSSLLLSSGSVTLNAEGNPNAVFVFQIGTTLITGSNTSVSLINGAQACNVFWQVGSSATLGTGTSFVGTIMASATITANTAATIHGRLLAETGAVNLDTNTITTSNCASSSSGAGGGSEAAFAEEAVLGGATTPGRGGVLGAGTTPGTSTPGAPPSASRTVAPKGAHPKRKKSKRHSRKHHSSARPALPHERGAFTG
jgi:hypothetical protein